MQTSQNNIKWYNQTWLAILLCITICYILSSCSENKKYVVIINKKDSLSLDLIIDSTKFNAPNDSAAYSKGYSDFLIEQVTYVKTKSQYSKIPLSFKVLNTERKDVSTLLTAKTIKLIEVDVNKLVAEADVTLDSLSNNFKKTEDKKIIPKRLTDEEYLTEYSSKLDNIKLEKMFAVAPLYGDYADALNNVLLDMEDVDSLFNIFKNKKIKSVHDKYRKMQEKALSDYVKYGNPDDEDHFFIFVNSACETALEQVLNDPDYDVVKDKYYLKQTAKGYNYKLIIRGKNAFGAKILKEMTFSLQYNPFTKEYDVTNVW
jgi:hypothetical protein